MTAQDKIAEAEYFLGLIEQRLKNPKQIFAKSKEFDYELNAFINATRSIVDHLLQEYNEKFGLHIALHERLDRDIFERRGCKQRNMKALDFIDWFNNKFDKIKKDNIFEYMVNARNLNTHRVSIPTKLHVPFTAEHAIPTISVTASGKVLGSTPKKAYTRIWYHKPYWYFDQFQNMKGLDVCKRFLKKMKKLVNQTHTKYPL